jgi:predicted nuclease with TOPRIM domain
MTTDYESNNKVNTAWEKTANLVGVGLLMVLSYQAGLAHGRGDKTMGQYVALKAQYQRIETEYSELKAQYDRIEPEYSTMKTQCDKTVTQYAALKAQYDRIEGQRSKP